MIFNLMKDVPWMFVIAGIIWLFVAIGFFKRLSQKNISYVAKYKVLLIVIPIAVIATLIDIWIFIYYIPTHFKKHTTEQITSLAIADITSELNQIPNTDTLQINHSIKRKDTLTDTLTTANTIAKIYTTTKASIRFFSSTPTEDIEATNTNVVSSLNNITGEIRFVALIKGFQFENELMQDHFNTEEYMNSDSFPKSEFKGNILNMKEVNFTKNGTYPVTVSGLLTIHGITHTISAQGSILINNGKISTKSVFKVNHFNYGITTNEIADELEITVTSIYN